MLGRTIVSKNFKFLENNKTYNIQDLYHRIDYWKYALRWHCDTKAGDKIALGITEIDFDYIAIVFACLELGLQFVVLDYSSNADKLGIKDFKNDVYGKIDIFLHHLPNDYGKLDYYSAKSTKVFDTTDLLNLPLDRQKYNSARQIYCPDDTDMLFCTSSGTTGTPKIVKHNHKFMYELVQRNKKLYKGSALHIRNLHHGSSLAVYFLPTLASDDVDFHMAYGYNVQTEKELTEVAKIASENNIKNISFPFSIDIDIFLKVANNNGYKFKNINLYTLSYINPDWKNYFNLGIDKFESIFGCNETSGPLFLSQLVEDKNFSPVEFIKIDDFYKFTLYDNKIDVELPVYNTTIEMNDIFEIQNDIYVHKGRHDIVKINQIELNLQELSNIPDRFDIDGEIITDTVYNKLYLALWNDTDTTKIDLLKNYISEINPRLQINDTKYIDKNNFFRGIKIDKEMIRDYFRC